MTGVGHLVIINLPSLLIMLGSVLPVIIIFFIITFIPPRFIYYDRFIVSVIINLCFLLIMLDFLLSVIIIIIMIDETISVIIIRHRFIFSISDRKLTKSRKKVECFKWWVS